MSFDWQDLFSFCLCTIRSLSFHQRLNRNKSQKSVIASAAVGLFGSEGCVQFTQCSQSYGGSCWIFIATCPLPSPGWAYQMRNNMRSLTITYFFKKLARDFFISETDLVTIGLVIVRSSHFLKTYLFLEMQSVTQTSVFFVCTVNYSLFLGFSHRV